VRRRAYQRVLRRHLHVDRRIHPGAHGGPYHRSVPCSRWRALAECLKRHQAEEAKIRQDRARSAAAVAQAVAKLDTVPARANCTALYAVTVRALQRSQHTTVVTDGANTCRWYRGPEGDDLAVPVPANSSLLFLLVPSTGDRESAADRTIVRASLLEGVFPAASVQLLNETTDSSVKRLAVRVASSK